MPTEKRRLNLTIDDATLAALAQLAEVRGESMSSVGIDLIRFALDLQEDRHFSAVADKRLSSRERRIPHAHVWK